MFLCRTIFHSFSIFSMLESLVSWLLIIRYCSYPPLLRKFDSLRLEKF